MVDWQKCMNQAVDYIEDNLSDEIDYGAAAQFMNCSVWEFQRLFSFMAQVPLSEYIRRRRLTLAAHDIQVSHDKVIDVASRYGYESPASFSRAFNQLHGTTPKSARDDGVTLKVYPRLIFKFILKGVEPMDYKVEEKGAFQVIGRTKRVTANNHGVIGTFWHEWNSTKMFDTFHGRYAKGDPHDMCVSTLTEKTDEFDYTIGFLYNGAENADGFDIVSVPGGSYVVFTIPEEYKKDVGSFMGRCITEYLPAAGYELAGVDAEYFSKAKWEAWFLVK
jgi:AraC family transcriptional regulator